MSEAFGLPLILKFKQKIHEYPPFLGLGEHGHTAQVLCIISKK